MDLLLVLSEQNVLLVSFCKLLVPPFIVCPVPDVPPLLPPLAVKQLLVVLVLPTNPALPEIVMLVTLIPHLHPVLLLMLVLPVPLHVLPV